MKKQYIIRKYVMAENAQQALKIESKQKADECWVDEEWKNKQAQIGNPCGFKEKKVV